MLSHMDRLVRILSGIQPSGFFHLGNYFGMMQRMIAYQDGHHHKISNGQLYTFIANYHALTICAPAKELRDKSLTLAGDYLALGLDPKKSIFWRQSDVPEVTELAWILSQHVSVSRLELAHSFKEKVSQGQKPRAGLFFYPVLMAADVLAFGTDIVPVGKDQTQHLEICREIARSFNRQYGQIFRIPKSDIVEDSPTIPGTDGRKMSKSYQNIICPFFEEQKLKKSIMSIRTDSSKTEQEKTNVTEMPLYQIFSLFAGDLSADELLNKFQKFGSSFQVLKEELFSRIMDEFRGAREIRRKLDDSEIHFVLEHGAQRAKEVAMPILTRVREAVGLQIPSANQ